MNLPDVILLNGGTSSGKSSIARGLQAALADPYINVGVDHALGWTPQRWMGTPEGFQLRQQPDGTISCHNGEGGFALARAWHRMVRASVDAGVRVIVDEVLFEPRLLEDWLIALAGADVFFVGVRCELAELERRERERGDRGIGQARHQHRLVHARGEYDLEIDTTHQPRRACVDQIIAALPNRIQPSAFDRLRAAA